MISFQIPLLPSLWECDVYIGDRKEAAKALHEKYGESEVYYEDYLEKPMVGKLYSLRDKQYYILCYLEDFEERVVVHECLHITHYYAKCVGAEFDYDSQEHQALLLEYLYDQIMKHKDE